MKDYDSIRSYSHGKFSSEPCFTILPLVSNVPDWIILGSSPAKANILLGEEKFLISPYSFYDYYLKKRSEGKCHRVALSHVCKKLVRVIYCLEKNNIDFDPSLLK